MVDIFSRSLNLEPFIAHPDASRQKDVTRNIVLTKLLISNLTYL